MISAGDYEPAPSGGIVAAVVLARWEHVARQGGEQHARAHERQGVGGGEAHGPQYATAPARRLAPASQPTVVYVPRRSNLKVDTYNGPIGVREVKGRMALTAYNGPVLLDGVGGDVHARTTNGPADIRRN